VVSPPPVVSSPQAGRGRVVGVGAVDEVGAVAGLADPLIDGAVDDLVDHGELLVAEGLVGAFD
jgi:hypothetical protein